MPITTTCSALVAAAVVIESGTVDAGTGRPLLVSERWIRADAKRVVFESAALAG